MSIESYKPACRAERTSKDHQQAVFGKPNLADVLCAVPVVLDRLDMDTQRSLQCCNKQLQALIYSTVETLYVSSSADVARIANNCKDWPLLSTIVLCDAFAPSDIHMQFNSQLQLLAEVSWCGRAQGPATVTVFVCQRQLQHSHQSVVANALCIGLQILQRPIFSDIETLVLKHCNLGTHDLTLLTAPCWRSLLYLNVSGNDLNAESFACIAKGNWPKLDWLDVSMCGLSSASMAELVRGQWPVTSLQISANPRLDGAAMSVLANSGWSSVEELAVTCMKLDVASIEGLFPRNRKELRELDLRWTGLDAAVISTLGWRRITRVQTLDFTGNSLDAAAMAALVKGVLPKLAKLVLAQNDLDAASMQQLCKGKWRRLEELDLSDNLLDSEAMQFLAQGDWPCLATLSLAVNHIDVGGIKALTEGKWLRICSLNLCSSLAGVPIWDLLGLQPTKLQTFLQNAVKFRGDSQDMYRLDESLHVLWPDLIAVTFSACDTTRVGGIQGSRSEHKYDCEFYRHQLDDCYA